MNTITRLMLVSVLMIITVPAYSARVVEVFHCAEASDAVDEQQIEAAASEWLAAARGMKGGDQLEAYLEFPVVGAMGENDFTFVLRAPSLEAWGQFWDGYPDSPVEKVDEKFDELAYCSDSTLYESVKVE